ncbi:MAG: hypothetical protein HYS86_04855 [Candidatus Chisholmbacteria bacterium]|nr:hypothetical protein [Candidatus Chisholmbacteria bacterium]
MPQTPDVMKRVREESFALREGARETVDRARLLGHIAEADKLHILFASNRTDSVIRAPQDSEGVLLTDFVTLLNEPNEPPQITFDDLFEFDGLFYVPSTEGLSTLESLTGKAIRVI